MGIWTYPEATIKVMYFWLVIDGEFRSAGFLTEPEARAVWRELYDQGRVLDTCHAQVFYGPSREQIVGKLPVN